MLNHCFEFGANKQRLKVWFAQSALAADASEKDKKILLDNMSASPAALQLLALKDAANSSNRQNEFNTLALIQNIFFRAETFCSRWQFSKFYAEPANRMD